jgi:hypothetical protein
MSILIKGMEMPKTESEVLIIAVKSDGSVYPVRIDGEGQPMIFPNEEMKNRAVPVPPHGRLIDADEFKLYLAKMLIKYAPAFKTDEYAHFAVQLTEAIASDIDEAPTIIPAEEGET